MEKKKCVLYLGDFFNLSQLAWGEKDLTDFHA